jgi:hypothetical protein
MKDRLLIILLVEVIAASAHARIGENQTQMSTRYGVPREDRKETNATATLKLNCTKTYDFQGWNLKTDFANGLAEAIVYRRADDHRIEPGEIEAVLKAESGGWKWTKIREGLWANSNGASAAYDFTLNQVVIKSAAVLLREDAERNRKAKPRTAPAF